MPHSSNLGTIATTRPGPVVNNQATTELIIQGNLNQQMKPLIDEGAFYVTNTLSGAHAAQAVIRHVAEEGGSTILRFENRERRNDIDFAPNQAIIALRPFSYGNVRDSDPEPSLFTFGDAAYGRRAGERYPLWNWSVLFSDFDITDD
jgi:hypothetical protein